ncbi:type 2 periplasmic-binding domain-containing protein [Paenibacillus roseipurpureus]|uniref:Extracellular solute-binding protein n=1 Tax=Paenibacillus roseopurpureus TaxID=2918901 RepID=A0AA96RM10_9BACL|nr:extracellular solute-binding protein [Paenibacillus sp. MBLB1832]WNR45981.1 extracellular solute-binding protein [Paenibacillus sp. MBLB1832]
MKKTVKKQVISLLALAISTGTVLAACSKGSDTSSTSSPSSAATSTPTTFNGKFDPPITLTAVKWVEGDNKFKQGESIENNVLDKTIAADTGIQMKYLWTASTGDAYKEKLRLSFTANEEMPEIVMVDDTTLMKQMVDSGKYREVGDLFDKYAGPTWKEAVAAHPESWNLSTINGKKYGFPMLNTVNAGDDVLWIREDWLKKLNLKAPTTIDEMDAVLEAFTKQDPDGNGKADTFGLSAALKDSTIGRWMGDYGFVFGAYGVHGGWSKGSDGKLMETIITPAAKQALTKLSGWVSKGYIPQDAGVFDEMKAGELFNAGKAGMIVGNHWLSVWPFPDLKKNVPTAEFKPYPLPVGPDGKTSYGTNNATNGRVIMVSKVSKHPEAVPVYLNWFYENYLNPKKGSKYEYGLAENYDWAVVDGKPTNDKAKVPNYLDVVRYSIPKDFNLPDSWIKIMTKFTSGGKPETPLEVKFMGGLDDPSIAAAKIILDAKAKGYPQTDLAAGVPATSTRQSKGSMLDKMKTETWINIIYGKQPVDSYDKFISDYKAAGYEQYAKEVNEWYQANIANK